MGKGSTRRPTSIPKAELEKSWDRIFGNKSEKGEKDGRTGTNGLRDSEGKT